MDTETIHMHVSHILTPNSPPPSLSLLLWNGGGDGELSLYGVSYQSKNGEGGGGTIYFLMYNS